MLYDHENWPGGDRSSSTPLEPRQLLEDLTALVEAGLIVPVRDREGEVRVTPAEPLEWDAGASRS
jgi:hypothetical protein